MKHYRTTKVFLLLCIFSALTLLAACSGSGAPFGYDFESIDTPQTPEETPEETTLTLSTTTVELNAAGDAQVITVTSNTTWSVLSAFDNSWLNVKPSDDGKSLTVSATANDKYEPRSTTFTVETTDKAVSTTVSVTQAAKQKVEPGGDDNTPPSYSRKD